MRYGPSFEPIRGLYLDNLTNEKQLWVLSVMRRCLCFLRLLSCHDFRVFMSDLVTRECSVLSRTQVSRAKFWVKSVRSYSRFFSPFSTWDVSLCERTFHCIIHTDLIVKNVTKYFYIDIIYIFYSPAALWFWLFCWSPPEWSLINDDVWHFDLVHCIRLMI